MKYINKLLQERHVPRRTADFEAQDNAYDAKKGKPRNKQTETEKSERASLDVDSQITRRAKSGEKKGTKLSTDDQTATGSGNRARRRAAARGIKLDHTVYHDMGMLMAESLGLVSEEDKETPRRPVQSTRKPSRMAIPSSYSPMTPKQKRMSDAMDRDRKLLRRRAGASGNETSTD
jgi:hypothetical protein